MIHTEPVVQCAVAMAHQSMNMTVVHRHHHEVTVHVEDIGNAHHRVVEVTMTSLICDEPLPVAALMTTLHRPPAAMMPLTILVDLHLQGLTVNHMSMGEITPRLGLGLLHEVDMELIMIVAHITEALESLSDHGLYAALRNNTHGTHLWWLSCFALDISKLSRT